MRDELLKKIKRLIIQEVNPKRIILFGSRGKGNYQYNSDYDLAIDTKKTEFRKKRIIKEKLNDIAGLHTVDVVFINEVDKGFREIILETGKVIYEKRN